MTCVTLLIIDYQFKIRTRILLTAIKRFLLLILTRKLYLFNIWRKLSVQQFTCMLNTQKFDIMTLSETWLKDNPHLWDYVKIDGYEVKFRNREHTRGGGVGLYIRSDIKYKLRNDIVNTNTDIEHLWLERWPWGIKTLIYASVYFISQTLIISPNQYGWTRLMTFYPMHAPVGITQLLCAEIWILMSKPDKPG